MDEQHYSLPSVQVFYSYASEDEEYRLQLEKYLSLLRRQGAISEWHNRKITPGDDSAQTVATYLNTSSIIFLLICPDFMASDYCYQVEMQDALQRQASGFAYVIPIILRPVDWQNAPCAALPCLPHDQRPVTLWHNQDEAFYDIALGIREAISAIHASATTTLPPLLFEQGASRMPTTRTDQNRRRFLKRVHATWITGVLEHSLYNATLIALGLHEQPDAVRNPWHLLMQETDQEPHPVPPDTHITQIFDAADGELLILGEPGAGKTTLLLQLARDLLARAERDASSPLPVILNLSSWAEKRPPLLSWLVDELHDKYAVPRKLAISWLTADQMLLLLDGLDEVAQPHRAACIAALNQYRQQHNLTAIVVCSRRAEYMTQSARLTLRKAVRIQPLTSQQIDAYLSNAGSQLSAVRSVLQDDASLCEMAETPLMLNILMLTYQNKTPDDLTTFGSPELRRDQVFEHYIQRMLERRTYEKRYSQHQTRLWLTWLASQMKLHGQTEFYIERVQHNWLISRKLRLFYRISSIIICFLIVASISLFIVGSSMGLAVGLLSAVGLGLPAGLIAGAKPQMQTTEAFTWSWRVIRLHWFLLIVITFAGSLIGMLDVSSKYLLWSVIGGPCLECY